MRSGRREKFLIESYSRLFERPFCSGCELMQFCLEIANVVGVVLRNNIVKQYLYKFICFYRREMNSLLSPTIIMIESSPTLSS